MKKEITIKKRKGEYNFYYKGKNITGLWMDFFSRLHREQESKCEELFIKKYRKKLDKMIKNNK